MDCITETFRIIKPDLGILKYNITCQLKPWVSIVHPEICILRASSFESQAACGRKRCSCMLNRGLREEFCTHVHTHLYLYVWSKTAHSKTTLPQLQLPQKCKCTSRGAFKDFFCCKCNAKNNDIHDVSLHTVEECRGGRRSMRKKLCTSCTGIYGSFWMLCPPSAKGYG